MPRNITQRPVPMKDMLRNLWRLPMRPNRHFQHRDPGVPDLCHMQNLIAVELHDVDVIRRHHLARGWNWTAVTGVSPVEHGIGRNDTPHAI